MSSPIGSTTGTTGTTSTSAPSSVGGTGNLFDPTAFLQLLVAELKNQDPTQPVDGKDMIAQLATLTQVQSVQQSTDAQQRTLASTMIGKTVTGQQQGKTVTGLASGFTVVNGKVNLIVNDAPMDLSTITKVETGSPAPSQTTPAQGA